MGWSNPLKKPGVQTAGEISVDEQGEKKKKTYKKQQPGAALIELCAGKSLNKLRLDLNTIFLAISWLLNSFQERKRRKKRLVWKTLNYLIEIAATFQRDTFMGIFFFLFWQRKEIATKINLDRTVRQWKSQRGAVICNEGPKK